MCVMMGLGVCDSDVRDNRPRRGKINMYDFSTQCVSIESDNPTLYSPVGGRQKGHTHTRGTYVYNGDGRDA